MVTDPVPTMTNGAVRLRAHTEADVADLVEQCVDPLTVRWTTVPLGYAAEDARRFVREIMPGGWASDQEWGFAVEVGGRYAGTVVLRHEAPGRAEIAYASHPWVRGTGAMTTALRLLVDWGFAARGLQTLVWRANRGNWASRKAAWRQGFTVEGTLRRYLDHRGELVDAWVGTLLRGDSREPKTTWLDVPRLHGPAVVLRPVTDDDVPRIVEACRDPRTRHWLANLPSPYDEGDAREWMLSHQERAAAGTGVSWALADAADDRLLGALDLFSLRVGGSGVIGYWTHPDARGRGLMRAAVPLALGHSFETLGLQVVRIGAALGNAASRHVIESTGFRLVGTERRRLQVDGKWVDAAAYDLTAADWSSRR